MIARQQIDKGYPADSGGRDAIQSMAQGGGIGEPHARNSGEGFVMIVDIGCLDIALYPGARCVSAEGSADDGAWLNRAGLADVIGSNDHITKGGEGVVPADAALYPADLADGADAQTEQDFVSGDCGGQLAQKISYRTSLFCDI